MSNKMAVQMLIFLNLIYKISPKPFVVFFVLVMTLEA